MAIDPTASSVPRLDSPCKDTWPPQTRMLLLRVWVTWHDMLLHCILLFGIALFAGLAFLNFIKDLKQDGVPSCHVFAT